METTKPSPPWADESSADTKPSAESRFKMIDVGAKAVTARRAFAQGSITMNGEAFTAIREGRNPKGDVLALAEVAGLMAGKKTADLIPLCHPLPLDYVRVKFRLSETEPTVFVYSEAGTHAKTGVEMEALAAVTGALLTIYDLSKAVHPALTINEIRLNRKEGGKSGVWTHPSEVSE